MTKERTANTEGKAILEAIRATPADAPTACSAWTAHDLVAHLAAGAKEIADLVEDRLEGRPGRATRGFEEREAPFRSLPHVDLVDQLVQENLRKLRLYDAFSASTDPSIAFTGTRITAERLATHSRSEAAIHRWDLIGDDAISQELLSQPDLTMHATWVLDAMPTLKESAPSIGARASAAGHPRAAVALAAQGSPDVVLRINGSTAKFQMAEPGTTDADLIVTTRPDHRLLALWGRRPRNLDYATHGDPHLAASLESILWPDAVPWG
jgi:Mycothiol maleylpyruvate isomerase N-terminal domain